MSEENKDFEENQNNGWGDDDDSFGLPELNYDPIGSEEENSSNTDSDDDDSSSASFDYNTDDDSPSTSFDYNKEEENQESHYAQEDDSGYGNGRFTHDYEEEERRRSSGGVIATIIIILLLAGGAAGYMYWYKPMQDQEAYDSFIKQGGESLENEMFDQAIAAFKEAKKLKPEESLPDEMITKASAARDEAAKLQAEKEEAERLAREEAEKNKKNQPAENSGTGTVEKLVSRTGKYYVVIASNIDVDLATDYANRLSKQGVSSKILVAPSRGKYNRVALGDYDSYSAAEEYANTVKGTYSNAWVVKF